MKRVLLAVLFAVCAPLTGWTADPAPSEIVERLNKGYEQLNFEGVAPYIHSHTILQYRKVTTKILAYAVEKNGEKRVLPFFQGLKSLKDLDAMSDTEYWSFLMANSAQFYPEKPIASSDYIGEVRKDKDTLLLVYASRISLSFTPGMGSFLNNVVYVFHNENGVWKLYNFAPNRFDDALHWFLQQGEGTKWESLGSGDPASLKKK